MWLQDTGILKKLRDDELNARIPIPDPIVRVNQALTIYQLGIALVIQAVGQCVAIDFFAAEFSANLISSGRAVNHI